MDLYTQLNVTLLLTMYMYVYTCHVYGHVASYVHVVHVVYV